MKCNDITIKTIDYRPCYVKGERALFHRWSDFAKPLPPSASVFGDKGGQFWQVFGIVELENGEVIGIEPSGITFTDNLVREYAFEKNEDNLKGEENEKNN